MKDYYNILNVSQSSSKREIKAAFWVQAKKWHPDRNNSTNATERMQHINEAYLILYDDEARSRYDAELRKYESHKKQSNTYDDYAHPISDDLLKKWINGAKEQSKNVAKNSLDDLVGISQAAASSAFTSALEGAKVGVVFIVVMLIFLMFVGGFNF